MRGIAMDSYVRDTGDDDSSSVNSFEEVGPSAKGRTQLMRELIAKGPGKKSLSDDEMPDVLYTVEYCNDVGVVFETRESDEPLDPMLLNNIADKGTKGLDVSSRPRRKPVIEIRSRVSSMSVVRRDRPRAVPLREYDDFDDGYHQYGYQEPASSRYPSHRNVTSTEKFQVEKMEMVIHSPELISALSAVVGYYPDVDFSNPAEPPIPAGTTTSTPNNNNHSITLTTSAMASRGPPGARGMSNRFAQFKLVLLGESAVGKSSIVLRFVKDQFDSYRESTIGAAFLTQTISLDENTTVKFEIWDTAGQERYKSLAPMYYRNANCAVVVYDITQASSLDKAKAWVKELQRQANENIIIALAGNKLDLVNEQPDKRAIPTADAEAYAKEARLLFFETSAKTAENVQELFTAIAKRLPLEQAGPRHGARGPGGQASRVSLAPEGANTQTAAPCSC